MTIKKHTQQKIAAREAILYNSSEVVKSSQHARNM